MKTEDSTTTLHLVYDLHTHNGHLIAPAGTPIEIIDETEAQAHEAATHNRTTFRHFSDPLATRYVIRLTGGETLYSVNADHIG